MKEQERPRLPAVAGEAAEAMEAIYIPPHRIVHLDLKVGFSNQGWKKPSPVGFFCFLFFYIFAQKREFFGFFQFQEYFRCIQTLNYNHFLLIYASDLD